MKEIIKTLKNLKKLCEESECGYCVFAGDGKFNLCKLQTAPLYWSDEEETREMIKHCDDTACEDCEFSRKVGGCMFVYNVPVSWEIIN